jgi:hypothetical protein
MTAVGHHHVCLRPTNTCLVNWPVERNFVYPVGPDTKKVVFLPREPTIGGGCVFRHFSTCFNIAFPLKRVTLHDRPNIIWLSKDLIVSSKRLQTLNNLKRTVTLMDEAVVYIPNCQRIYKRVLKEAKKRQNDRFVIE